MRALPEAPRDLLQAEERSVCEILVHDSAVPFRRSSSSRARPRRPLRVPREVVLLSRSDVHKLLEASDDPRIRLLIALAAATGLRRQEILHLKWSDVDGDSTTVRPKDGWESKTYQRRKVYVPSSVLSMLVGYRRARRFNSDDDWIFTARDTGKRLGEVSKPLRRAFASAGLYKRWTLLHGVRHSAASEMLLNGTDLRTLMEILRHKNLTTTQRYVHTSEDAKRAAANRALV